MRVWVPCNERLGGVARPAADIDDAAWGCQGHLANEIVDGAGPLLDELEVLAGGPILGFGFVFMGRDRCGRHAGV